MRVKNERHLFWTTRKLILSQSERNCLERAAKIAEKIREYVGELDYDNSYNMVAADVEHGAKELLEGSDIPLSFEETL